MSHSELPDIECRSLQELEQRVEDVSEPLTSVDKIRTDLFLLSHGHAKAIILTIAALELLRRIGSQDHHDVSLKRPRVL